MPIQENLFDEEPNLANDNALTKQTAKKKPELKRRKKANRKIEDYYALLEIDENAAPATIKRSYIEKVRLYPPENHPAEFQKIRTAYDNLRDPKLRKEYNILRHYGESIDDLLQEAANHAINNQTIKILERAVTIDPQHIKAHIGLAYAYIFRNKELLFHAQFYELKKLVTAEQWPDIWSNKITLLLQVMRTNEAFAELQTFQAAIPDAIQKYWFLYLEVYSAVSRQSQLLQELESRIQAMDVPAAADIGLYTAWIHLTEELIEKANPSAKAQSATRKLIQNLKDPQDTATIIAALMEEYHHCREDSDFSTAKIFVDLALSADKKNKELQQCSLQMQTITTMFTEIERAADDMKLFPPVLLDAMRWFTEEFQVLEMEDMLATLEFTLSEDFAEEFNSMTEEYAAGIIYLKKKFPTIYRYYQQRWDTLFKEKTAGLNREARRGLRL
ncbi:MAG TPA: DnaJ domain-containing protein [Negativicutes bacterium]|jgi:hypothetical protein